MQSMTLQEIAQAVDGTLTFGGEIRVDEISTDTRKIRGGSLYLALKGERFDGHDFISKAIEAGARAVVSDRPVECSCPVIQVPDTRLALGTLAAYYRQKFSLLTVGVTGSVGKTSTKEMIAAVLAQGFCVHKTQGNFNNDIGLPMTLFGLEPQHTAAVIEMGMSALGEISYLSQLAKPDLAVITNVGVSHLENLGSRENILKAKLEILDGMSPNSKIVLNADNDMLQSVRDSLGERAVWFGIEQKDGFVFAEHIEEDGDKTRFDFVCGGERYPAMVPAVGIHNVYNALAGFTVGMFSGIAPEKIVAAIGEYQNSGLRQSVREYDGIKVIADCYNACPDSMQSALSVIRTISCSGKRYAVLGDMLELGECSGEMHYKVGKLAAKAGLSGLLCYGEEAKQIARGALEAGFDLTESCTSLQEAVNWLHRVLRPGDAVILKASRGMHLESVIESAFEKAGGQ